MFLNRHTSDEAEANEAAKLVVAEVSGTHRTSSTVIVQICLHQRLLLAGVGPREIQTM